MTVPKLVGILVDQYGLEADVWYHQDDNYIVVMIGDCQDGGFMVDEPCLLDPQQVKAHESYEIWQATGKTAHLNLTSLDDQVDDDEVIELFGPGVITAGVGHVA